MHLTGHSMGGHGTWHNGVMSPGRFATLGPSAGWQSFYTYGGSQRPSGAFARARAHSDTANYLSNLAKRGVYIIHGTADDNVPLSEGRTMFESWSRRSRTTCRCMSKKVPDTGGTVTVQKALTAWTDAGACSRFMQERRLDPFETDFRYAPPPWLCVIAQLRAPRVCAHSRRRPRAWSRCRRAAESRSPPRTRSMRLNTRALREMGVSELVVDGEAVSLDADELWLGPETGKRAERHGPFNQVFHKPFCLIYDASVRGYAPHAAYLAQALGAARKRQRLRLPLAAKAGNPVFIGGTMEDLERFEGFPVSWDDDGRHRRRGSTQGGLAVHRTDRRRPGAWRVGHDPRTRGPSGRDGAV